MQTHTNTHGHARTRTDTHAPMPRAAASVLAPVVCFDAAPDGHRRGGSRPITYQELEARLERTHLQTVVVRDRCIAALAATPASSADRASPASSPASSCAEPPAASSSSP
jgi:hypothetical protein